MSSFLYRVGRAAYRRRGLTLAVWLLVLVLAGGGAGLFAKSFDDAFTLPGTQSQDALDSMKLTFPQMSGASGQVIVVAPQGDSVRDSDLRDAIEQTATKIEQIPQVDTAASPFDKMIDGAISDDDSAAIINVQFDTEMQSITESTKSDLEQVAQDLQGRFAGSQVQAGGEIYTQTGVQLSIVEVVGVVVAMIVLFLTLGSFRAAGMPLLTALLGVGISMMLIVLSTALTKVNSTTPMLALMLGLAVGIDYALFIVSRHRDQLGQGMDPEESAAQSVATAGSAVVFAGLTVMIALAGLSVARIPFLGTMGIAASVAVLVAVLIALTLLPALLGFAGEKLRPKPKKVRKGAAVADGGPSTGSGSGEAGSGSGEAGSGSGEAGSGSGDAGPGNGQGLKPGWPLRWVRAVTKVPALTIAIVILVLGALSLPAMSLQLSLPNNGTQKAGSPAKVTYDLIDDHFGEGYNGPLIVTADIIQSNDPLGLMEDLADEIRDLPGVEQVPLATPNETADTGIVQVVPTHGPSSPETQELVKRIRDLGPHFKDEYGVDTAVTGATAMQIDVSTRLAGALLPFALLVVGLSLILLAMVFRSIAVPLKATIGYLLSVGASFGTVALVFEKGWFNGLLNVEQTGPVISFLPIILMGVLFGLAMDYEVFLVSRMREDYVHGGHLPPKERARHAIESGFNSSAKVVVAAAVIMFSVFAAFVPEGESIIKSIALGLAVGVFVDAFIVRMTLVPAVLALLGPKAWYLPRWLDRLLPTFDVEGESLQHQLALKDWPHPGSQHAVHAEGLAVTAGGRSLFHDVKVSLQPGEVLLVEDPLGPARKALLLCLSGRLAPDAGRAKVGSLVLPEQAGQARRRTSFIDVTPAEPIEQQLAAAVRSGAQLIMIDGADQIRDEESRTALAKIISGTVSAEPPAEGAPRRAEVDDHQGPPPAVILGVARPEAAADLLPDNAWHLVLGSDESTGQQTSPAAAVNGAQPDRMLAETGINR